MTKDAEDKKISEEKIKPEASNQEEALKETDTEAVAEESSDETVLKSDMEALENKFRELNESYLRLYADFDNYKKRTNKEKADTALYAAGQLMEKLLPVIDNFERAIAAQEEETPFYTGVKMVYKQLGEILEAEGLKTIEAVDSAFDPNLHHAVMTENLEEKDDNTVTQELQRGYMYKDKVLRPSMVKVNKK